MEKITVYGLPLNPMPALEQLRGASFCVSYGTRDKLGKQLDQAIELVGENQILLVDNGAFSAWQNGVDTMSDETYLEGFATWANDITARCPQAIVVLPDVIDGTVQQNHDLACECTMMLDAGDRLMPIWHMHEPISYLLHLCEGFHYIGIGSSGAYANPKSAKWNERIKEAFAAIDKWEADGEGAYVRPRIHMMRAQDRHHLFPFDSSDSTNVAVNHNRWARTHGRDNHVARFAARVDAKIQASAGPEAEHQKARPLADLLTDQQSCAINLEYARERGWWDGTGPTEEQKTITRAAINRIFEEMIAANEAANADGLDIPEFLKRAA